MRGKTKFYILLFSWQVVLIFTVIFSVDTITGLAAPLAEGDSTIDVASILAVSSAVAIGASVLGAAIAIKTTGTAAISVLAERPEAFFKAFLVVALGEALAVYGLIIAILLWTKI